MRPAVRSRCALLPVMALVALSYLHGQHALGQDLPEPRGWPTDWSTLLGQTVTIEGTACNAKLGAMLKGDGPDIWIDGLDAWPPELYLGHGQGKRVMVTGTVTERYDLPIFVQEQGRLPKSGMPVAPGTNLEEASKRFLLRDPKWFPVE